MGGSHRAKGGRPGTPNQKEAKTQEIVRMGPKNESMNGGKKN